MRMRSARTNAAAVLVVSSSCSWSSAFTGPRRPPALRPRLAHPATTTRLGIFRKKDTDAGGDASAAFDEPVAAKVDEVVDSKDGDVKILSASVLPSLPPAARVEVFYAE